MRTTVASEDFSSPIVRRKSIEAENKATLKTKVHCGEYGTLVFDEPVAHGGTGEGPSPLQGVLAALCGCKSVTFNRTAKEMGFLYSELFFSAEFTIDVRGRMGLRGVVPHFRTVRVDIKVITNESLEFLQKVVQETEARCPVYNLICDAQVDVKCNWVKKEK